MARPLNSTRLWNGERLQKFAISKRLRDKPVFGNLDKPLLGRRDRVPTVEVGDV